MCDHHGITPHALAEARKTLAAPRIDRRGFLRRAGAMSLTMSVGSGLAGMAQASTGTIRSTHGGGFCNINLFLSHAEQLAKEDGLDLEFVITPTFADQVTFLGTGQVDVGVTPYTSFMALFDAGVPLSVVAGGGVEGCALVAQPGLDTPEKLKGKTLGTFQMDTLEVLAYDWLRENGVSFNDITVRYIGGQAEGVEIFRAGGIDMFSTIEPFATAALQSVPGAVQLSNGIDLYGPNYTDCVLVASNQAIEQRPEAVKALIRAMMRAQYMVENDPQGALDRTVGTYFLTSMENAQAGMSNQPAIVDARDQSDFILNRVDSVMDMGYIRQRPGPEALNWTLLEEVIAENQELFNSLRRRAA